MIVPNIIPKDNPVGKLLNTANISIFSMKITFRINDKGKK